MSKTEEQSRTEGRPLRNTGVERGRCPLVGVCRGKPGLWESVRAWSTSCGHTLCSQPCCLAPVLGVEVTADSDLDIGGTPKVPANIALSFPTRHLPLGQTAWARVMPVGDPSCHTLHARGSCPQDFCCDLWFAATIVSLEHVTCTYPPPALLPTLLASSTSAAHGLRAQALVPSNAISTCLPWTMPAPCC